MFHWLFQQQEPVDTSVTSEKQIVTVSKFEVMAVFGLCCLYILYKSLVCIGGKGMACLLFFSRQHIVHSVVVKGLGFDLVWKAIEQQIGI